MRRRKEGLYMVTKIVSGRVVEKHKSRVSRRPGRRGMRIKGNSSERKMVGNREQAVLRLSRALNCNMGPGDLFLTAKLDEASLAALGGQYGQVKAAGRRFLERLCYRLKKHRQQVKWFLVPSEIDGETGEVVRPHVHIVISGGGFSFVDKRLCIGQEAVNDIWGLGTVDVQFLRHQEDYYPLAAYLVRQARGVPDEKKWTCSRNLAKPKVTHEFVSSGGQLRTPPGALVLPGTRYDPEKGQNLIRYIPSRRGASLPLDLPHHQSADWCRRPKGG